MFFKGRQCGVIVFDIRPWASKTIARKGAAVAPSLNELGQRCDVIIVMAGYDHQIRRVVSDLAQRRQEGAVIVKQPAIRHGSGMRGIGRNALGIIDALVCFGPGVDRNGTLASLVGGAVCGFCSRALKVVGRLLTRYPTGNSMVQAAADDWSENRS
jgi:3-hydroxyisobutyrate dehydrogenase-like beta-hydroxyacid dehydrogenase